MEENQNQNPSTESVETSVEPTPTDSVEGATPEGADLGEPVTPSETASPEAVETPAE